MFLKTSIKTYVAHILAPVQFLHTFIVCGSILSNHFNKRILIDCKPIIICSPRRLFAFAKSCYAQRLAYLCLREYPRVLPG